VQRGDVRRGHATHHRIVQVRYMKMQHIELGCVPGSLLDHQQVEREWIAALSLQPHGFVARRDQSCLCL
jgi:hypothetical protein